MNDKNKFVFGKDNYIYIISGIVITIIGFILMMGGGSEDRMAFNGDELFSSTRITLAPFLVILGYVIVIYGIMKKRKIS